MNHFANNVTGTASRLAGDAADFITQKAAPLALAALVGAGNAYAGDTMKISPVASQVAPIKVEVTKATLQELNIDPRRLEQFNKLSAPRQGLVLFFLDGLKKAKLPETATLKNGAEKLVFLFTNHEINETSRQAMSKMDGTLGEVVNVERIIAQLSDPQTYGAILATADSPYGQRFSQAKQEMIATYNEAKKLHDVAKNMESPELVAARQRLAEDKARLAANKARAAAAEQQLAEHQAELERNRATNAALGRVVSSFH